jgi:hypothetical protein
MSEVLRQAWAIARSGWRASWNRSVRFSRMKTALIVLAVQAAFFLMVARRTPAAAMGGSESLGGLVALMALQMGWFGLTYGFGRGQMQLYQGILVPLFQITPARPLSFLLGRVVEAVPARAWSCLLWSWVYARVIPGPARWAALAVLAVAGFVTGMVAHLAGLLILAVWSRYSPRTMQRGLFLFGGLSLALFTWAAIFLARGGTVTALALIMRQYRPLVYGGVLLLAGIPGLLLLGALLLWPSAVEALYRQGVYQVLELQESAVDRPHRSRWLPLRDAVLRAVLSREWLELSRSRIARVQLMIWIAGTVGTYYAGLAVKSEPLPQVLTYVGGLGLFSWFMAYGHWVVRVFEKERRTMLLYRLAAVPAPRLLLAKFVSIFVPSALLLSGSVVAGSVAAGLSAPAALRVWLLSLLALASGTLGGFGVAAATFGESDDQELEAAPRQDDVPQQAAGNAWWAVARTVGLLFTAALPLWAAAGHPPLSFLPAWLPWLMSALLPLGLLTGGYWLMTRQF